MYYFLPKAAEKPVYSYRLSIVHFWSLVFLYIWAGPHHLLYTALPDWAQTLGMIFSLMLWAPSWGGMINGLLTLRGAWDRVRVEPILKFFVAGITFYGMSTFEGPLLSIKSVNGLAHYTDWIIGHVHGGALGWNGFIACGMIYWLVPKLWKSEIYSQRLANIHFWTGFLGIILYIVSMWAAGITQGLMLQAVDATGKLQYPDFIETTLRIIPLYWVRAAGGTLYLTGYIVMIYNLVKTLQKAPKTIEAEVVRARSLVAETPVAIIESATRAPSHRLLEGLPTIFAVLSFIAVIVGTIIELVPTLTAQEFVEYNPKLRPYTALQLQGRDLYVREGCYVCHSQMVRPMISETLRYGEPSKMQESAFDHPFQWGSRRTGPDLARVGGKYPDGWHYRHMRNPREISTGSIMPAYPWLFTDTTDFAILKKKLSVMKLMGVPYTDEEIANAEQSAREEAAAIAAGLKTEEGGATAEDKEIIALIAYLQRLGQDYKKGLIQ
jgi:cytochrome c oxidase cbb3-type subunit I/II